MDRSRLKKKKSPFKKSQPTSPLKYNFLQDPHLIYYLQSPARVIQLLESSLYELDNDNLIELETMQSLKISEFVLDKIPGQIKQKHQRNQDYLDNKSNIKSNFNESMIESSPNTQKRWDDNTNVARNHKRGQPFYSSPHKQNWRNIYCQKLSKPNIQRLKNQKYPDQNLIKGLKKFQQKIL